MVWQAAIDAAGLAFAMSRTAEELEAALAKHRAEIDQIPDCPAKMMLRGVYARKQKELSK